MSAHPTTPEVAETPDGRELAGRHCSECIEALITISKGVGLGGKGDRCVGQFFYQDKVKAMQKIASEALSASCVASEDTARLDWLEENQVTCFSWNLDDQYGEPTRKLYQCNNVGLEKARDNIREAIDAARFLPAENYESKPWSECPFCGEATQNASGYCCLEHEEGRRME